MAHQILGNGLQPILPSDQVILAGELPLPFPGRSPATPVPARRKLRILGPRLLAMGTFQKRVDGEP